jgi:hypothetical protein
MVVTLAGEVITRGGRGARGKYRDSTIFWKLRADGIVAELGELRRVPWRLGIAWLFFVIMK